jgi:hypothetical protein
MKVFQAIFLILLAFPLTSKAEKVPLTSISCEVYEANSQFVQVKTKSKETYLVKAEIGERSCTYLLSKNVGGYALPLCEDFSRKNSGVSCNELSIKEFVVSVWPKT